MRYVRFERDGTVREGEMNDDGTVESDGETFASSEIEFLPPFQPTKIVAAGKNYPDHIAEMERKGFGNGEIPEFPFLFYKPPSSLIGNRGIIEYPRDASQVHYEGEVGIVIGDRCRDIDPEEALDSLAGYTAVNDVSLRDWAGREQNWVRSKGPDTFLPAGPCLQTDVETAVELESKLNGEVRQEGNTGDMVFSFGELVSDLSQYMTLEEGDLIATGTPSGVGSVTPGDTVEVTVEGVGTLTNEVRKR